MKRLQKTALSTSFILLLIIAGVVFSQNNHYNMGGDTLPTTPQQDTGEATSNTAIYSDIHVIDGDTVHVKNSFGEKESIRLLGVDAPEIHHTSPEKSECYGEMAREVLEDLLSDTTTLTVVPDPSQEKRDTYGRLLGYIQTDTVSDINKALIEFGAVKEYTHKGVAYERQDTYRNIEAQAKENNVGLWGACSTK